MDDNYTAGANPKATKESSKESSWGSTGTSGYLRSLPRIPLLEEDEEKTLFSILKTGTPEESKGAEEAIMLANMRLVISIAKRYSPMGCPLEDLISEGTIGLKVGMEKYKLEMGAKFATYAVWWIKQYVRRALNANARSIRIPTYQQKTLRAINQASNKIQELTGQSASNEEIAEEIGKPVHIVQTLRALTVPLISLQSPLGSNGEEENKTYEDILADNSGNGESPFEKLTKKTGTKSLIAIIKTRLNKNEQAVICLRYGINTNKTRDESPEEDNQNTKTLEEVGDILNLTRERIRQIQTQALEKLKRSLRAQESNMPTLYALGCHVTKNTEN